MSLRVITGQLEFRSALHVGSGQRGLSDALLRRDAQGRFLIPGEALAGLLRATATRLAPRLGHTLCKALADASAPGANGQAPQACGCAVCHLFGSVDPQEGAQEGGDEATGGRASRLWVYTSLGSATNPTIRDRVGIERSTGAAARQAAAKFDLEVLPAGAKFTLRLELEDGSEDDQQLLATVLAEWQAGRAALGGRVAVGLGGFQLTGLECRERTLADADALMDYLRCDDALAGLSLVKDWLPTQVQAARAKIIAPPQDTGTLGLAGGWLDVTLTLHADGPFLTGDTTTAEFAGVDYASLRENGRFLLPGAVLRGVLRSHAERIARTLATIQADKEEDFLATCPACNPLARPTSPQETLPLQTCDTLLKISSTEEVAEEHLCLACRLFGSTPWGSRLVVEDAQAKLNSAYPLKAQDFLAIDRFTGGGRDGAKFDAVPLWQPRFTARLRLENPRAWELGWLALTLRDLAEGWLTVGFGRSKGFGKVRVSHWEATVGFLHPADVPVSNPQLLSPANLPADPPSVYRTLAVSGDVAPDNGSFRWPMVGAEGTAWLAQANAWVEAFGAQVSTFCRAEKGKDGLPRLPKDTYFGQEVLGVKMPDLYQVRGGGSP